ncbi:MAG: hypothetical protein AB7N61_20550 [Acidimicrobiia bacterium]
MNTDDLADQRADRIAARATGFGAGLITFMLTWTIGARITEHVFEAPTSAYVAMITAFCAGIAATLSVGHRLVASVETTAPDSLHEDHSVPASERVTAHA